MVSGSLSTKDDYMKKYRFHVVGMHCNSCVVLTENELGALPEVSYVKSSLKDLSVDVHGDFGDKNTEHVARDLSDVLKPHGYSLALERQVHNARWEDFAVAIPLAGLFVAFFILLQKFGVVNLVDASEVGYGTAFLVGIIASISTCMAVVGGLVLSMSANYAKEGEKVRPQVLFHIGRIVSFFILGGVIGSAGSVFQFGAMGTLILNILLALVLFVLGVNLLDVFPGMKRFQPTLPSFLGKRVHGVKNSSHSLTPVLVGVATFFLPCGFTQSMQLYTLTTGSFVTGSLIMGAFALGTFPVLALLSFSSLGIKTKSQTGPFFKTAGLVVIFFALFNLINALAGAGIISPLFSF